MVLLFFPPYCDDNQLIPILISSPQAAVGTFHLVTTLLALMAYTMQFTFLLCIMSYSFAGMFLSTPKLEVPGGQSHILHFHVPSHRVRLLAGAQDIFSLLISWFSPSQKGERFFLLSGVLLYYKINCTFINMIH